MQKYLLPLVVLLFASQQAYTQNNFHSARKQLKDLNYQIKKDSLKLIQNKALNTFLKNKVANYFSSANDLSLSGNFAVLNTTDKKISLGHNWGIKRGDRVRTVIKGALNADIKDGFATLYDKSGFAKNLGLGFQIAWIRNGSIFYDDKVQKSGRGLASEDQKGITQIDLMNEQLDMIRAELNWQLYKDSVDFNHYLRESKALLNEPRASKSQFNNDSLKIKYYRSKKKEILEKYNAEVLKRLESYKYHNALSAHWFTLGGHLPITGTSYSVATELDTFLLNPTKISQRLFEFELGYNYLRESKKWGIRMFSILAGVNFNNPISVDNWKKHSVDSYWMNSTLDTIRLREVGEQEGYVGDFTQFWTPYIKVDGKWFFLGTLKPNSYGLGVHLALEKNFGDYNPWNGVVGLPIKFKGNEKPVTFELQAKFNDITNKVIREKKVLEKMVIGISVGTQFGKLTK